MIGGKVNGDDIRVEVESLRFSNIAPLIYADKTPAGGTGVATITTNGWAGYFTNPGSTSSDNWRIIDPGWSVSGIDAFGNRQWSLNKTLDKNPFEYLSSPQREGVAGKYYSMEVDLRTFVSCMDGNIDYVPQPPARINLYATNGNEAEDVLIAYSGFINPIPASNYTWPFHPGYREWRIEVKPVAPMPVGKLNFRTKVEYDTSFTAVKSIYLPASYTDKNGVPTHVFNLNFFALRWKSLLPLEHSGIAQEWVPVSGGNFSYDYTTQSANYNTANKGWRFTKTINREETMIPDNGMRVSIQTNHAESDLYFRLVTPVGTFTQSFGNVAMGRYNHTFPASCFNGNDNQEITLTINSRGITSPMVRAAIMDFHDFDGRNFYKYDDWTQWATSIDVNMYDTEVSTCNVQLRERSNVILPDGTPDGSLDVGDWFGQGKRFRLLLPSLPETYYSTSHGIIHNQNRTLFVGNIERRKAVYPKKARKGIDLLVTNAFPLLQEKTSWALPSLSDYWRIIPSLGVPFVSDSFITAPVERDPYGSMTGEGDVDDRWVIRDLQNGFPILDAMTLTRNSTFGYFFIDKFNRVRADTSRSTNIDATFADLPGLGENSYANLDVHFDSDAAINSIKIREYQQVLTIQESTFQRTDAIVETENTVYDANAIKKYRKAEVEFRTFKKTNYEELQYHILDKYAVPKVRANTLIIPLFSPSKLGLARDIQIYSLIKLKYRDRVDAEFRVNRIRHTIIPGKTWRMELGFGINHDGVYW